MEWTIEQELDTLENLLDGISNDTREAVNNGQADLARVRAVVTMRVAFEIQGFRSIHF